MSVYANIQPNARIPRVEFSQGPHGNLAFFHLRDASAKQELEGWLKATHQSILAESQADGHPIIIVQSNRTPDQTIHSLDQHGNQFNLLREHKPVDPWVIRSLLGFGGQGLQLVSSFMRPITEATRGKPWYKRVDSSVFVFAVANLTANAINLAYRAQDLPDKHQLRFLKTKFNDQLSQEFKPGEAAISPEDNRSALRETDDDKQKRRSVDPINDFMKRNSVNVGELGLRYIGAFGLAFPAKGWSSIWREGKFPKAETSRLRLLAGTASIGGKTVALTSKVEDPYNPQPSSWLDKLREKFSFVTGGWIEFGAFSALAYDAFVNTDPAKNPARGISWKGKTYRDWLGGIGASMFVAGYAVRSMAKYGQRNVDMNELYAHVSDTLAKVPPEKMPQLLADSAMEIKTHFAKQKDLDYGAIYSRLANDLHQYHHIDVGVGGATLHADAGMAPDAKKTEPEQAPAPVAQIATPVASHTSLHQAAHTAQAV